MTPRIFPWSRWHRFLSRREGPGPGGNGSGPGGFGPRPTAPLAALAAAIGLAVAHPLPALVDGNGDGESDVWRMLHPQAGLPAADDDLDGVSNAVEAAAGTDPARAASTFAIFTFEPDAAGGRMQWPSVRGKLYQVERSTSLAGNSWADHGAPVDGVDGLLTAVLTPSADGLQFYRLRVTDQDRDHDGATDWEELQVGFDPANPSSGGGGGELDGAALLAALASPNVVTLELADGSASEAGLDKGRVIVHRSGNLNPLTVRLAVGGTATPGEDYETLAAEVALAPGQRQSTLWIHPRPDELGEPEESVALTLQADPTYQVGAPATATVMLRDPVEQLFLADLRGIGDTRSGASGYAALVLSADRASARLSLAYANLTSPQSGARLVVRNGAEVIPVHDLPPGQIQTAEWVLTPAGPLGAADVADALERGDLQVEVSTTSFPGEAQGRFRPAAGSREMPVPPTPPDLPNAPPDTGEASRFLVQASFGPTPALVAEVQALGYAGWIDAQLALPATYHLPYLDALLAADPEFDLFQNHRQEAWWKAVMSAPDQLRQRVAFALSEILVVSDRSSVLTNEAIGLSVYYDLLVRHAFGNYRTLLEDVTLSPVMGRYLTHLKNSKPDPARNVFPDENYAREVMQLFTIGLHRLHPDGTLQLDSNGLPLPTYGNEEIVGFAHVFTGWSWHNPDGKRSWNYGASDYRRPMSLYPAYHDTNPKRLLDGLVLPAGRTGTDDLRDALDQLFQHPNTGPFVCRLLIQRLVTANPSPGYLYRTAQVFADNGQGVRGDLGAVVRAILLDWEARAPEVRGHQGYGKQREPLLRVSALWRAFQAASTSGIWRYWNPESSLGQAALRSPTVFNFFEPNYQQPGPILAAGLFSPEFQITSETTAISTANTIYSYVNRTPSATDTYQILLNFDQEKSLSPDPAALVDHLNQRLLHGSMSAATRQTIIDAVSGYTNSNADTKARERAWIAVYLTATCPEFVIQR